MDITTFQASIDTILNGQRVVNPGARLYAVHYTRATTPGLLLRASTPSSTHPNRMRQYDGDYMNDPEEGRYLVDVMIRAAQASKHPLAGMFVERLAMLRTSKLLYSAYKKCTFLSCWTTTTIRIGREEDSDSLNHWRFYGDDGKGACIAVPVTKLLSVFPDQLYNVNYGTDVRGGGTGAAVRPIRVVEKTLKARFGALRKSLADATTDLDEVIRMVHPLLFLFKSEEYRAEQEVRSVVHKDNYSTASAVLFDERTPARAYVESNDGLISDGTIIYFGPKSDPASAIETMGAAANRSLKVQVLISTKPYR